MSKSIYSEEELEQLIQNLFLEKRKAKELEQRLQILEQEHQWLLSENKRHQSSAPKSHECEEIEKLKGMLASYKKKSAQAIHALYENEQQKIKQENTLGQQLRELEARVLELTEENTNLLKKNLTLPSKEHVLLSQELEQEKNLTLSLQDQIKEAALGLANSQKHNEQLERVLKHLHDRSQEAYLELGQLREDYQKAQEAVSNLSQQLKLSEDHQREYLRELTIVQQEKQDIQQELKALQEQLATLRTKALEDQEKLKTVLKEKKQLENQLMEKNHLFAQFENELGIIKQDLSKGMKEAKEIQGLYLDVVNEKAALYNKATHLDQITENHVNEIKTLKQQLENEFKKKEASDAFLNEMEMKLKEKHQEALAELQNRKNDLEITLKKHHDLLHAKEAEIEESNDRLLLIEQEKIRLENALADVARYQNEQDAHMKAAQQHLGKKVKETALLNEKIEEQKSVINDLQSSMNQLKIKMGEMQTSFDHQLQLEKKHQEKLHETVRYAEGQAIKWEDKYLKANEKLKILEERQLQMQTLFASLTNVIGNPLSSFPAHELPVLKEKIQFDEKPRNSFQQEESPDKEDPMTNSSQPSLFDVNQQSRKNIRQNLFD